jgi:hypothetical protein
LSTNENQGRAESPNHPANSKYEKPSVAWQQEIDVKRLSVGCTRQEFNLACQVIGLPFGS